MEIIDPQKEVQFFWSLKEKQGIKCLGKEILNFLRKDWKS